jgi:erythromycin esterase
VCVRTTAVTVVAALSASHVVALPARAQANLGFERKQLVNGQLTPTGWMTQGADYEISVDTTTRVEGRASLQSRRRYPTAGAAAAPLGAAFQQYGGPPAIGRTLRLSGWIRTDGVTTGYAGFWIRVDGQGGRTLATESMASRGPRRTTPWTRYEVEVPVDSSATFVVFGVIHHGNGTAWFDSLAVEVVGPPRPRSAQRSSGFEPPPRPGEDFTRLLTDAELAVASDSGAPEENAAWVSWVREHARPIRSLGARDFADLRFLAPLLEGKRIVQLGESGHGVREFNMAKVRLIQFLHEELGYDVIAFESSLFECDRAGRSAALFSADELMRRCIFSVWHTEEVLPLFEYVKRTQGTTRPLVLSGFDVQSSSPTARERPGFLRRVVAAIDDDYARRVFETDSAFAAPGARDRLAYAREARDRLVPFYDSLAAWLRANERALATHFRADPAAPMLARQTAVSMSVFVRQLAAGQGRAGTEIRDRGMADNLDFLLNELHPGKKVIVWAHNFHIQHRGYGGSSHPDSAATLRTMGTHVAERHRRELYTVGLYMYRGSAAHNTGQVYSIPRPPAGSLESILHRARWRYSFVDLSRAERMPGTEWMFRISAREWGLRPQMLVPRDEYDGILFVDQTWPPQYIR